MEQVEEIVLMGKNREACRNGLGLLKKMAEDGVIYIGYMLRQELNICAYLPDKDRNGKLSIYI